MEDEPDMKNTKNGQAGENITSGQSRDGEHRSHHSSEGGHSHSHSAESNRSHHGSEDGHSHSRGGSEHRSHHHSSEDGHSNSHSGESSTSHQSSENEHSRPHRHKRSKGHYIRVIKKFTNNLNNKLVKYKPKYLYRKYKSRFKSASVSKKIGYIILAVCIFAGIALTVGFAVNNNNAPASEYMTTTKEAMTTESSRPKPPKVNEGYNLKDPGTSGDFITGFMISLPQIAADKPVAAQINGEIDKIKDDIKIKYNAVTNINDFKERYDYSYTSFAIDSILFISIYKSYQAVGSDPVDTNTYFVYNFISDSLVENYDLSKLFSLSDAQMLDAINAKMDSVGKPQITSMANIPLNVSKDGKLMANVGAPNDAGGTDYYLVQVS